jgi:hypothetical protein
VLIQLITPVFLTLEEKKREEKTGVGTTREKKNVIINARKLNQQ